MKEPREIQKDEVYMLKECLKELAVHHNRVSVHFRGNFPSRPYEQTLLLFEEALRNHSSRIAVMDAEGDIAGFCKIDFEEDKGKLDYLVVLGKYRKKGYGKVLMDWAMQAFDELCVHSVEVKVIDGNEAIALYEKYGFRMNAHILLRKKQIGE